MTARPTLSRRLLLGAGAAALAKPALAQAWPSRPITLVVGYPPGGQTDFAARIVQAGISKALGQPVVIENRGGAGGNLGLEAVLRSRPDGYTFLASNSSPMVINPHTFPPTGLDPLDLINVCMILDAPLAYCVHPSVPVANAVELVAWIKAQPAMIDYGIPASGSLPHLAMELFRSRMGLPELQPIPYRGSGPALQDFLAGRFPVMTDSLSVMAPALNGRQVRGVMATSTQRVSAFPDIPTGGEQGIGDFVVGAWTGISAPQGTPPEMVARMNAAVNEALRDPNVRERIEAQGAVVGGGTAEAFDRRVRADHARWGEVARKNNITSG
ncbi:tripartite tricarboxylate transporter substrate binding protein [Pseudoroseomonas wenyumeiae]|uniref:Tripartite tricarboxylate transporter substrate binding protein n=1 Tax=Teichococcus wenyumeiae TaxID=2478470 RepID=A0A3A9JK84_9PROT|nr:tripartite tricarboxylate transporter substrate binding protein [Pseudoroseomonas wenyumeiae]RKK05193.1 tripartite tricarboxylate transporter substrate binding protein [Pseudoroseomonas wenyumeiae]RMI17578.1 tripartite tricarboxylate transporter substrate binding protein [Pseudoroseomonas wenyumeiae]